MDLYAHSGRETPARSPQLYCDHISNVVTGVASRAKRLLEFASTVPDSMLTSLASAASLHDLGKLAAENQKTLSTTSKKPLVGIRHEEAGTLLLLSGKDYFGASLVAAHHRGLTSKVLMRDRQRAGERALGNLSPSDFVSLEASLPDWIAKHGTVVPVPACTSSEMPGPLVLRLALSCLVDSDHSDAAGHDSGQEPKEAVDPKWGYRSEMLRKAVALKPKDSERDSRRQRFTEALDVEDQGDTIAMCSAPVGSGKTLAVMAHLLRVAARRGLRHIFVVLPFTNIVSQSADAYRSALVGSDENPDDIVAELHHLVDAGSAQMREYAALWRAPIIVTTAVAFFQTLAACSPAALRKLHELPGSAVFIDEAHAALPTHLWPVTWKWLRELSERWGSHFVLGSGTLFEFWKENSFPLDEADRIPVPDLTPGNLLLELQAAERKRLAPTRIDDPLTFEELADRVFNEEFATVVVLNTVWNAALLAKRLRLRHCDPLPAFVLGESPVLHLSTALAPRDRTRIVAEIKRRLVEEPNRKWTLVATSCIEAGLDLSFQVGYREAATVASLIQLGGRVRRNAELWTGALYSFRLSDSEARLHPAMKETASIVDDLLRDGEFATGDPSDLLSKQFRRSLRGTMKQAAAELKLREARGDYPEVERLYRVIDADTRLVVIDEGIANQMSRNGKVSFRQIIEGSVQIYSTKLRELPCRKIGRKGEFWQWTGEYDSAFLGYMADGELIRNLYKAGGAIV